MKMIWKLSASRKHSSVEASRQSLCNVPEYWSMQRKMIVLVQTAETKYHRLVALNKKHLFLTVLEQEIPGLRC